MHPEKTPTSAYPRPINTRDSCKLAMAEGPTKKKIIPDKRAESINVTRLSTFDGILLVIKLEVMKNAGQMAKNKPIYIVFRLNSVSLSAKMGSMSA